MRNYQSLAFAKRSANSKYITFYVEKHALYLQDDNCETFEHPGNDHMIALTLRNKGQLKEIIDNAIN